MLSGQRRENLHGLRRGARGADPRRPEAPEGITEKKMFGGIAFLAAGNMCVGVNGEELMVRVGPEAYEAALARKHTREMDFTGRPLRGYVSVAPAGIRTAKQLRDRVGKGLAFARSLPAKD